MNCLICEKELVGKQKKFCSQICKCKFHNYDERGKACKIYHKQKEKGYNLKREFIELKGGKCEVCGYDKSLRALTFHHRDPQQKSFPLDVRHLGNRRYSLCFEEFQKCDLLCFNCHMELHESENGGEDGT